MAFYKFQNLIGQKFRIAIRMTLLNDNDEYIHSLYANDVTV